MRAAISQRTICRPCTVCGRGYWSGKPISLSFEPAAEGAGIRFVRSDLPGEPAVLATLQYSTGQSLRTQLKRNFVQFEMIEHVMAAICGLGISNLTVSCSGSEMPGLDGSAYPIALSLASAGLQDQQAARHQFRVTNTIRVDQGDCWIQAEPIDRDGFIVSYSLDYGSSSPIGKATFCSEVTPDIFLEEIASARTFVTAAEAAALQSRGLGLHVTHRDLLVFDENGPLDNQLRYADECARHKALDVIGDLALVGVDLIGKITAHRSGHQLNAQLARRLQSQLLEQQHAQCERQAA